MPLRIALKWLLVLTLALPVVALVLAWAGGMLRAMGDPAGAIVVGYVVTLCQVLWAVGLVGLVILLAMLVVSDDRTRAKRGADEPLEGEELE